MQNNNTEKCKFIRSRMTEMPILPDSKAMENDAFPSGFFWCTCTMGPVGPDDDFVAPEKCKGKRSCYQNPE